MLAELVEIIDAVLVQSERQKVVALVAPIGHEPDFLIQEQKANVRFLRPANPERYLRVIDALGAASGAKWRHNFKWIIEDRQFLSPRCHRAEPYPKTPKEWSQDNDERDSLLEIHGTSYSSLVAGEGGNSFKITLATIWLSFADSSLRATK